MSSVTYRVLVQIPTHHLVFVIFATEYWTGSTAFASAF